MRTCPRESGIGKLCQILYPGQLSVHGSSISNRKFDGDDQAVGVGK